MSASSQIKGAASADDRLLKRDSLCNVTQFGGRRASQSWRSLCPKANQTRWRTQKKRRMEYENWRAGLRRRFVCRQRYIARPVTVAISMTMGSIVKLTQAPAAAASFTSPSPRPSRLLICRYPTRTMKNRPAARPARDNAMSPPANPPSVLVTTPLSSPSANAPPLKTSGTTKRRESDHATASISSPKAPPRAPCQPGETAKLARGTPAPARHSAELGLSRPRLPGAGSPAGREADAEFPRGEETSRPRQVTAASDSEAAQKCYWAAQSTRAVRRASSSATPRRRRRRRRRCG